MLRRSPLRRGTGSLKRNRIRRAAPERAAECRAYSAIKAQYLAVHPFCQIFLARHGLDEAEVFAAAGGPQFSWSGATYYKGLRIPRSTQIHHRNKRDRDRLNDVGWWLAACQAEHDLVENNKSWARDVGLLLPINADKDGRMPAGCVQPIPTPQFMAEHVGKPIGGPF